MKKTVLSILALLLASLILTGSPARKGAFLVSQPDGTTFSAVLRGDEFGKVMMTADGCAVLKGSDGYYRYAIFNPDGSRTSSGYKVGESAPQTVLNASRSIPWRVIRNHSAAMRQEAMRGISRPATRAGTPEKRHCIIILAQFKDVKFKDGETRRQDVLDLITKRGTGSVMDYLDDQFHGSYEFNFTVGPIVTLSKDISYYGSNEDDKAGKDIHPQELVKEACTLSDPYVDFSQFDDDGNGSVDQVFVIVAGKNEAEGADPECLWPHQWYLPNLVLDGKRIWTYALSTEYTVHDYVSGQAVWDFCAIGTFCHEFSHTLGLVDCYDTDGEGSGGEAKGLWGYTSLMDSGNFNDYGRTPPNYNALDRELLGTGRPEVMKIGTYTLEPVEKEGRYLILENPKETDEFFLFECRAQTGWDKYIGGSGLAIYHIDMSSHRAGWSDGAAKEVTAKYRWYNGEINCNPSHECADMIETTGDPIDVRQAFFPYKTSVSSFNPRSDPPFRFNDGTESPYAIAGITRSGNNVTFIVYDSAELLPGVSDLTAEVYQDAAILTWRSGFEDYDGDATVTWGKTSGSTTTVSVSPYEPGKYSLTLEGLSTTTAYTVDVVFKRYDISGDSATVDFLTKSAQEGKPPYIYLEYLSDRRKGGRFLPGTGLPLRVYNAVGEKVGWYFDGASAKPDGSGYFHPAKSGTLKAVVYHSDGSQEILTKEITFTE